MTGYAFHPEAEIDLDEIWAYISDDNASAADRVIADIGTPSTMLSRSRIRGTDVPI